MIENFINTNFSEQSSLPASSLSGIRAKLAACNVHLGTGTNTVMDINTQNQDFERLIPACIVPQQWQYLILSLLKTSLSCLIRISSLDC